MGGRGQEGREEELECRPPMSPFKTWSGTPNEFLFKSIVRTNEIVRDCCYYITLFLNFASILRYCDVFEQEYWSYDKIYAHTGKRYWS